MPDYHAIIRVQNGFGGQLPAETLKQMLIPAVAPALVVDVHLEAVPDFLRVQLIEPPRNLVTAAYRETFSPVPDDDL